MVSRLHGPHLNFDAIHKWVKLKWKIKGNVEITARFDDYIMLVLENAED